MCICGFKFVGSEKKWKESLYGKLAQEISLELYEKLTP